MSFNEGDSALLKRITIAIERIASSLEDDDEHIDQQARITECLLNRHCWNHFDARYPAASFDQYRKAWRLGC